MIVEQVQFLDRHHLFIKFGSVDGGVNIFFADFLPTGYSHLSSSNCSYCCMPLGFSKH